MNILEELENNAEYAERDVHNVFRYLVKNDTKEAMAEYNRLKYILYDATKALSAYKKYINTIKHN